MILSVIRNKPQAQSLRPKAVTPGGTCQEPSSGGLRNHPHRSLTSCPAKLARYQDLSGGGLFFAGVRWGAGSVVGFIEDALGLFSGKAALAGKVIRLGRNLKIGDRFGDWFFASYPRLES